LIAFHIFRSKLTFKDYLDALLHDDTVKEYDRRMRDWIEYYWDTIDDDYEPYGGDTLIRENVEVPPEVPESHWWWKELSRRPR
jgi:hypothetical protein